MARDPTPSTVPRAGRLLESTRHAGGQQDAQQQQGLPIGRRQAPPRHVYVMCPRSLAEGRVLCRSLPQPRGWSPQPSSSSPLASAHPPVHQTFLEEKLQPALVLSRHTCRDTVTAIASSAHERARQSMACIPLLTHVTREGKAKHGCNQSGIGASSSQHSCVRDAVLEEGCRLAEGVGLKDKSAFVAQLNTRLLLPFRPTHF